MVVVMLITFFCANGSKDNYFLTLHYTLGKMVSHFFLSIDVDIKLNCWFIL